MKRIFYLLTLFCVLLACKKSDLVVKEDNTPRVEEYLNDAKYLYIREINSNPSHPNYKSIALDTTEINKIYGFIKSVYALKIPQRDTIFDIHKIHIYNTLKLSDVTIFVSDNGSGMQNLMNGVIPTGNTPLDSILQAYGLIKNKVFTILKTNGAHYVDFKTKRELNIAALENKFKHVEGVIYPVPFGGVGDGNRISLSYQGNKAILDFSYGFGDCPAGCTGRTNWIFEIENNIAKFIERKSR